MAASCASLDPEALQTARETWEGIAGRSEALGIEMFLHMFEEHPNTLKLFSFKGEDNLRESPGLRRHSKLVIETLGEAVTGKRKPAELAKHLHALSGRHANYGVAAEDLEILWASLLHVLRAELADRWTPGVASAWEQTWVSFRDMMEPALVAYNCPIEMEAGELAEIEYIDEKSRALVVSSWESHISQDARGFGTRLFLRMFHLAPSTLKLFPFKDDKPLEASPRLHAHADKYMRRIGFIVRRCGDHGTLIPYLQGTTAEHVDSKVEAEHFVFMGKSMLWAWEQGMGDKWTPELREAWGHMWATMSSVMKPVIKRAKEGGEVAAQLRDIKAQFQAAQSFQDKAQPTSQLGGPGTPKNAGVTAASATPTSNAQPTPPIATPTAGPPTQSFATPTAGAGAANGGDRAAAKFYFVGTCLLYEITDDGPMLFLSDGTYLADGTLGIVLMGDAGNRRRLLVYEKTKRPVLQVVLGVGGGSVLLQPDVKCAFEVNTQDGGEWLVKVKKEEDQVKLAHALFLGDCVGFSDTSPTPLARNILVGKEMGCGRGDTVRVRYTMYLEGEEGRGSVGAVVESNREGKALEFKVGGGGVLPGIDMGVEGMAPGELKMMLLPPSLAYRETGLPGKVPPNSVLYVELILESSTGGGGGHPPPGQPALAPSNRAT